MEYLLGLDLGTTYFKALVVDSKGLSSGPVRIKTPASSSAAGEKMRCRIEPGAFWSTLHGLITGACAKAGIGPGELKGISYASQANSFMFLDSMLRPVTPLILWPDTCAEKPGEKVHQLWNHPDFPGTTGLGFQSTLFAVAKIAWIQVHQPDVWERTRYIMTISDYLTFGLTGVRKGDAGTASLLGLLDIQKRCWWPEAVKILDIDEEMLSRPETCRTFLGDTMGETSLLPILPEGIPLFAGSLDHHMAAIGSGLGGLADVCDSSGTVSAYISLTASFIPEKGVCFGPHDAEGRYFALAFDNRGLSEADSRNDAGLLRLAEVSNNLLRKLTGEDIPERVAATGGGARIRRLLQHKADLSGAAFLTTTQEEPGAFGAAITAAAGLGWFSSLREASAEWVKISEIIEPAGHDSL